LSVLSIFAARLCATAEVAVLTPVADTMLIEEAASNNAGGLSFFNAGSTRNLTRNRGLLQFDPGAAIPPGSIVISATLILEVVGRPQDGFTPAVFELRRLLRPWGEGRQTAADPNHPGLGAPAVLGEATWNASFALTTNLWTTPGAEAGTDFALTPGSATMIYGVEDSPYTFPSTPALVADVQAWLREPRKNHGWMLFCRDESLSFTARRFGSREDAPRAPQLVLEFTPGPRIQSASIRDGSFVLQFTAEAGQSYLVEYRDSTAGSAPWSTLANLPAAPAAINVTLTDPLSSGNRFYRFRVP
jgi:hypothetical protein